jgi:RNA polymerase sigma-70 factor (ECF subfamily)
VIDPGAPQSADRVLAERIVRQRDPAAFRELYTRHSERLFAMAVRLSESRVDAEDAVHDTWLRAVEGLERFEWRSSLRSWLTGILVNRIRELRRGAARDARDDGDVELAVDPSPLDDATRIDLERAIAGLAPRYREVFVLHDVEGFTHDEIAGLLGIDPGTSKSQLARARCRLRRALAPERAGDDGAPR